MTQNICLVNAVGLTPAIARGMSALHGLGEIAPLRGSCPAVTLTSQANMLTGKKPSDHGIVANGWYHRQTQEVRFWQQGHHLLEAPVFFEPETTAQIFWWFAQGGPAKWRVIPKPHYGCDGGKAFDVLDHTGCELTKELGDFPFHAFWGPFAGLASSRWIAQAAVKVMERQQPKLTMVYLPHLDYDFQRQAPGDAKPIEELNTLLQELRNHCERLDTRMVVVSEYGLEAVHRPVFLNRHLAEASWITTRSGPFGEQLLPYESPCFAVCDHQVAHVYHNDNISSETVKAHLLQCAGIDEVLHPEELGLQHQRSGQWIAIAKSQHWFDGRFWTREQTAPDYWNTIDIHRKPYYDPCELFLGSKVHLARRILQKKLGFRTRFDIIDPNPYLVRGSHGRINADDDGPVIVAPQAPNSMFELGAWLNETLRG